MERFGSGWISEAVVGSTVERFGPGWVSEVVVGSPMKWFGSGRVTAATIRFFTGELRTHPQAVSDDPTKFPSIQWYLQTSGWVFGGWVWTGSVFRRNF